MHIHILPMVFLHTTIHCNTLQHTSTHYNPLQHTKIGNAQMKTRCDIHVSEVSIVIAPNNTIVKKKSKKHSPTQNRPTKTRLFWAPKKRSTRNCSKKRRLLWAQKRPHEKPLGNHRVSNLAIRKDLWLSHVTCEWVMSHANESCPHDKTCMRWLRLVGSLQT